jgi:hypothetical protein
LRNGNHEFQGGSETKDQASHCGFVKEAGVNVREWETSPRGASNPNYCYEWAFIERGKVIVLTLWFSSIKARDGLIFHRSDPPSPSSTSMPASTRSVRARRWRKLLDGVREAYSKKRRARLRLLPEGAPLPDRSIWCRRLTVPANRRAMAGHAGSVTIGLAAECPCTRSYGVDR